MHAWQLLANLLNPPTRLHMSWYNIHVYAHYYWWSLPRIMGGVGIALPVPTKSAHYIDKQTTY
jgi:hypothetical protein